jgi:anthranilate phosphoribosyltransferase
MKYAAAPRREIGIRTVFNILGPLTNPAGAKAQVIGVPDEALLEKIALALKGLGCQHALVVHGADGMDEITTTGSTAICELKDGNINKYEITPEDFGLAQATPDQLKGTTAVENANLVLSILAGVPGPQRDIVVLNTAALLLAGDKVSTLKEGVALANSTIKSGKALAKLNQLIELSKKV